MREDMAKVIVERPRHGGGLKYPRGSTRANDSLSIDQWHGREAMKRPWQQWSKQKHLNENLAPLRRFLRSRLGRPWDKVYGEICQRINRDSAVQLHIWQHLAQYVCTDPHVIRGGGHESDVEDLHGFLEKSEIELVEEIDPAAARVTAGGGQVLNGPHQVPGGGWILHAMDPQGAMFALTAPRR